LRIRRAILSTKGYASVSLAEILSYTGIAIMLSPVVSGLNKNIISLHGFSLPAYRQNAQIHPQTIEERILGLVKETITTNFAAH
jgi:hypothetical protein